MSNGERKTMDPEEVERNRLLESIPDLEKAALFLVSVGEAEAAEVLKHLPPQVVQKAGLALSNLKDVTRPKIEAVIKHFIATLRDVTGMGMDSDEYLRKVLIEAMGQEEAKQFIERIELGGHTMGLDALKWMDPRAVADVIRNEHPQIKAIVVAYLDPGQSAGILSHMDSQTRLDTLMRVARLEKVQPNALVELNKILEKQFAGASGAQATTMGGVKRAAEIMNFVEGSIEESLMLDINDVDEELGHEIKELMFVFENLTDLDDRGMQQLLREVNTDVLLLALKGASEGFKGKVFKNMSKRAGEMLKDELEMAGPVKLSAVEASQKEILSTAWRMAEEGVIVLAGFGGEEMI
jgi:flagellar motor switch protein FliG